MQTLQQSALSLDQRSKELEAKVASQEAKLEEQGKQLALWQRWWGNCGESMCWYFYDLNYFRPPQTYIEWHKEWQKKKNSKVSHDPDAHAGAPSAEQTEVPSAPSTNPGPDPQAAAVQPQRMEQST